MIVVVGNPAWSTAEPGSPAGRACQIAVAAAEAGARVELVGRIGDDSAGDDLLIALSKAGVGHIAILRDPARATPIVEIPSDLDGSEAVSNVSRAPAGPPPSLEAADVALALQYLPSFMVLVASDDLPETVLSSCIEGAQFAGAQLVLAVRSSQAPPDELPADATVLAAPDEGGEAFARLVAAYAAALERGETPAAAFGIATSAGWERPGA